MTRLNLKRVIFVIVLSLSLAGFPAGNALLAQEDLSNRNELLSRIKLLRKNFEATSKKFMALKKRYERLLKETLGIEKRIKQEKEKIAQIKARRAQQRQKRMEQDSLAQERLKARSRAQRHKVIDQLLHQLESQKNK